MHQRGKLDEAEHLYRTILKAYPDHPDCRHLLGVLRFQQGRNDEALEHISAALKVQPSNAAALSNYGLVLANLGRLAQALASFDKALAIKPDDAEALNNRGNVLQNLKRFGEALASFDKALAIKPDHAKALSNRGNVLQNLKRFDEALASYDRALAIKPDHAEALNNRGVVLIKLKRFAEALASFDKALAIKPDDAEALNNRGVVLQNLKRFDEALASFDKALAIKPDHAEALNNRGNVLQNLKRFEEALASFDKALAIKPDHVEALNNRGVVLIKLKRFAEALASSDKALVIKPDHAEALNNRGIVLIELKRFAEALASCDKALAIKPDYAEALNNRGDALKDLKRLDEAQASYDKALAIKPDDAEALNNRGAVLIELKRFAEALASFNKALAIKPDHAEARYNRGFLALLEGRYTGGWKDCESRWEIGQTPTRRLVAPWPAWKGEDLREKRIIVYEEQGLGDVIQCCRFLTLLAARGAQVTFLVRTSLHRLLGPFEPAVRMVDKPPTGEIFDFQSALMSLPGGLNTTLENIPADIPYLYPEEPLVALWRERLGGQGFKVGICWQGKPDYKDEPGRSIPLSCFQSLARVPGVRLISLQKHHGLDQLENLPSDMRVETLGQDFDNGPDAFVDTAAVMSCLDLIITSDTSIAHLAGALGRPVWVALKHVPHWLWMLDRTDSPWYPTMTLYRQEVRDDWTTVFRAMTDDLMKLQDRERRTIEHILIPGSVGELFDKITILTIKAEHIKDPDRLRNVNRELGLLRSVEATCGPLGPDVLQLVSELQSINERLWAVEDELRACERRQAFGEEFIRLARAVYTTNDRRAAVKKKINILCGSQIIDEKSYGSRP